MKGLCFLERRRRSVACELSVVIDTCVGAVSRRSEQLSRDELLIRFMHYVCTGDNVGSEGQLTPLEHALSALRSLEPLCTDDVSQLTQTLTSLIKQQVTLSLTGHATCASAYQ